MTNPGKLPHYLLIKDELEKRILSGQLTQGRKFPSEEDLSKEFGVSTSTVKRAIGVLVSNGLLERTPGRGTFVNTARMQMPLRSFTEEMRDRGLVAGSRLLDKTMITAGGELAWHLDVLEGSQLFFIYRLRTANDTPVALEETYIPKTLCPDLLENDLSIVSLERLLEERYHLILVRAEEYVTARLATETESNLLGGFADAPVVLTVERKIEGLSKQRVMYNRTLYRADRYILHFDLARYQQEER